MVDWRARLNLIVTVKIRLSVITVLLMPQNQVTFMQLAIQFICLSIVNVSQPDATKCIRMANNNVAPRSNVQHYPEHKLCSHTSFVYVENSGPAI